MNVTRAKSEEGAFAIDALFGITLFLVSVIALMMISIVVKLESTLQYAVDQTAKQLSSYYYLLDAVDLATYTSGAAGTEGNNKVEAANKVINDVIDFSQSTEEYKDGINSDFQAITNMDFSKVDTSKYKEIANSAKGLWDSLKALKDDPAGQIKATISIFAHSIGNKALSYYVTPYLCRMLMPSYIAGDLQKTNDYLNHIGIKGNEGDVGMEMIDFSHSSLLADGRTIKIVAIYKLNLKKLTFGVINSDMVFQQTAVTAAWVEPNDSGTLKTISAAYKG